jgi:hypothetical protein
MLKQLKQLVDRLLAAPKLMPAPVPVPIARPPRRSRQ